MRQKSVATTPIRSMLVLLTVVMWSACDTGIKLDESGELVIEDVIIGDGDQAVFGKRVMIHATGSLLDGTIFDTSYTKNHPYIFTIGMDQVIEGWDAGVIGMRVGGQRILTVPPRMAFGIESSDIIPSNATVVYEIELLKVDEPTELGIEILREGEGDEINVGSVIQVHYVGSFGDATVFDSSIEKARPLTFTLGTNEVILGWDQGLIGMKQGEQRRLVIPPALAYGEQGSLDGAIPGNTTVVFFVELLEILD